jgi:hypothetical protein
VLFFLSLILPARLFFFFLSYLSLFLYAFAKLLRKTTVSFYMSVHLYGRQRTATDRFQRNVIFWTSLTFVATFRFCLKLDKINTLYINICIQLWYLEMTGIYNWCTYILHEVRSEAETQLWVERREWSIADTEHWRLGDIDCKPHFLWCLDDDWF